MRKLKNKLSFFGKKRISKYLQKKVKKALNI